MAHPFHKHREDKAGKHRVGHILKGHKRGGKVHHDDEAADRKLIKKMLKEHEKVEGKASGGRLDKYARGGKTKHHKGGNHVNIVVAPHGQPAAMGAAPPAGGPPLPGGGPPMPPPGMMPPGAGGPPMKRGGKVTGIKGGDNGEGRLAKKKAYGLRPRG